MIKDSVFNDKDFVKKIGDMVHHGFLPYDERFSNDDLLKQFFIDYCNCQAGVNLFVLKQIHSSKVAVVTDGSLCNGDNVVADAIVTNITNSIIFVRTADCVPIIIIDLAKKNIGIIHAGWRGLKSGIINNTIEKMKYLGSDVSDFIVIIGPCIRQCSYEVGEEFLDYFDHRMQFFTPSKNQKHYMFDLAGLVRQKFEFEKVRYLYDSNIDTYTSHKFASYRRAKNEGSTLKGSNISFVMLK